MSDHAATYSKIISPEEYNEIISRQHVYISASDKLIIDAINYYKPTDRIAEVVELGCGPARVLEQVAGVVNNIHLLGIDYDEAFLEYAKKLLENAPTQVDLVHADFTGWSSDKQIDIFYSQGVHHHIGKGQDLKTYLMKVYEILTNEGVYIVSDEFIPEYIDESARKVKAVIWYTHVIAAARRTHYDYLAQEEAKTLLDDLYESESDCGIKSSDQINLVLRSANELDSQSRAGDLEKSQELADKFLKKLGKLQSTTQTGDVTLDLSRGDYKICDSVFRKEVEESGFRILDRKTIGPVDTIGGMSVYILQKA